LLLEQIAKVFSFKVKLLYMMMMMMPSHCHHFQADTLGSYVLVKGQHFDVHNAFHSALKYLPALLALKIICIKQLCTLKGIKIV